MPVLNFTLPENTQSVSRPIIYDIINQLQTLVKIDKSAKIYFAGDIQKTKQPHSSLNDEDRSPQLPSDRLLFIEVEENYSKDMLGTNAINQQEHQPVFNDTKLNITIRPIYATTDVVINFKYRTHSKSEAERWHNEMWMKVTQLRDTILHDISYHYLLPSAFVELLKTVHDYREATDGYNDSFEEYLFGNATGQLTVIGDLANQDSRLAISEKQCRIVGLFDFDSLPEKTERDDSNASWTISFSYKFSYEKPTGAVVNYPIMIHNQILPKQYVLFSDSAYDLDRVFKRYSNSIGNFSNFEIQDIAYSYYKKHKFIKLPSYDEFIITKYNVPFSTHTVFTALCSLDVSERQTLLNLQDLGTVVINPLILQFILESEYPYICSQYASILQINLYRNEYLAVHNTVKCDSTGNIVAKDKLDLRNQHRIRFSFVTDLSLLTKEALERLAKYPNVLILLINELINLGLFNRTNRDWFNRYLKHALNGKQFDSNGKLIDRTNGYSVNNRVASTNNNALNNNSKHPLTPLWNLTDSERDKLKDNIQVNTVMLSGIIALRYD